METKTRSLLKTIFWRIVATLNSYFVLLTLSDPSHSNLLKAIAMNVTGFFVYYLYERIWTKIKYGIISD